MSVHAAPPPEFVNEPLGIQYATSTQLGKGGFAICFKAERLDSGLSTGHMVALKIVKTKIEPQKVAQKFITELQIHSKLSHPNIVGFYRAFSFVDNTYVVLELCSCGSLADLLKKRKCLTMPEIRRLMIQVCGAIKYLHTRNIVHRDLKTGNLFLDDNMNVKVGDFGLAALLVSGKDMDVQRRTTMCGTPNYLAPEILDKGKGHNEKVDLWAIGIIAYTLAVGRAPFHAASREEIYAKLKAGQYTWPELSSITNDISADLRDLVSTLLVPEELRPCPDAIVSHPFFRIAFVPTKMSPKQTTRIPTWPVYPPTPEIIQRGYSDSWFMVCKETGVGQYAPGRCFQLASAKKIRSVVRDIEREVAAGRQPVLPIPSDTVYTSHPYTESWGIPAVEEAVDGKLITAGRQLREISHNEVNAVAPIRILAPEIEAKKKKDASLMPPPPSRRGELTIKKTRSENPSAAVRFDNDSTAPMLCDRSKSDDAVVVAAPRQASTMVTAETGPPAPSCAPAKPTAVPTITCMPRLTRQQAKEKEATAETTTTNGPGTVVKRQAVTRSSRLKNKTPATAEVFEIYSDGEEEKLPTPLPQTLVSPVERPSAMDSAKPTKVSPNVVIGSDPDSVLRRLCVFRDNLSSALDKNHSLTRRRRQQADSHCPPLPFVSRWVDYSRKHGVGYVLEDGTIGFIASGATTSGPVTPVAVRQGDKWLRRIGKKFENLEKVPFHVYENSKHGVSMVKSSSAKTAEQREQQRMLRVLWVKFGRYMSQSLNGAEDELVLPESDTSQTDVQFVKFYQRMGNVGVWGFANGCFQLHFPDHTKLVFSQDGLHVSATMISTEGAEMITNVHELPARLLRDRETMNAPIDTLLEAAARPDTDDNRLGEMVRANMFRQKLEFLLQIVEQWIAGGGLGCSTGDPSRDQMQWTGLWAKDHAKKVDWVTVGRYGGDVMNA